MMNLLLKQCRLQINKHTINITPEKIELFTQHSNPSTLKLKLNKPLTLKPNDTIRLTIKPDKQKAIYFHGIITHIMQTLKPKTQQTIIAKTLDHKLTLQNTNHVYHQYSIEKLIHDIYNKYGIHYSLETNTNGVKTYNQLNQTDYYFLNQHLQKNKLIYYHDHTQQHQKLIIADKAENNIASHISIIKSVNTNNPTHLRYHFNHTISSNNYTLKTNMTAPTLLTGNANKTNNTFRFDFENKDQYQQTNHTELFTQHHAGSSFTTNNHPNLFINFINNDPNLPIIIGSKINTKMSNEGIHQNTNNITFNNNAFMIKSDNELNLQVNQRGLIESKTIQVSANNSVELKCDKSSISFDAKLLNINTCSSSIILTNHSISFDSAFISIN